MKRGFLNSSKAKAHPLGPSIAPGTPALKSSFGSKAPALGSFPIGKLDVTVPKGYESKNIIKECDPHGGSHPNALTFTTLPIDAAPGEQTSECIFYHGSKEVVMNLPGFPQPVKHPKQRTFRMKLTPGKGSGLFSTRALKMGDLILSERPLFVGARGIPSNQPASFTPEQIIQLALDEMEKMYKIAVDRMNPEDRAAFMALANSHKEDGSGPIVGIVRTNGVGIDGLRPGVEGQIANYSSVCKDISRMNHSCSPNTVSRWDLLSFSFQLFAVRDIAVNEELTYSYTDVLQPTAERHAGLKSYGFVCTCAACTDALASDARRAAISAFNAPLEQVNTPTDLDGLITKYRAQIARLEREGLEVTLAYSNVMAVLLEMYICKGDAHGASKVAGMLDKMPWVEKPVDVKNLLDPASPAYPAHHMWRSPVGSTAKMFQQAQQMASLTGGKVHVKPLAGGMMGMFF